MRLLENTLVISIISIVSTLLINNLKKNKIIDNFDNTNMNNLDETMRTKYYSLVTKLGDPYKIETDKNNNFISATWMEPLMNVDTYGKFGGLDYIKFNGRPVKKYHPHPAVVFIIVGKYMKVPEHLYGPLSYASETINIEKLFIPENEQEKYYSKGIKSDTLSLVTGSCASITISVITVKFVMDMIELYKDCTATSLEYNKLFRSEYDKRIHTYLCNGGIVPSIDFYNPEYFEEENFYDLGDEKCSTFIPKEREIPECKKES